MNAVLILLGGALVKIVLDGTYLRYVRPGLGGWVLAAGGVLVSLAGIAVVRAARSSGDTPLDAHEHGSRASWLLLAPVLAIFLAAPPALGTDTVLHAGDLSPPHPVRQNFSPLPPGTVAPMTLSDFVARTEWDGTRSLRNRTVRLTGFVVRERGGTYLARLVITCCAADATPMVVALTGSAVQSLRPGQWMRVDGHVPPWPSAAVYPPTLVPTAIAPIAAPSTPYEY